MPQLKRYKILITYVKNVSRHQAPYSPFSFLKAFQIEEGDPEIMIQVILSKRLPNIQFKNKLDRPPRHSFRSREGCNYHSGTNNLLINHKFLRTVDPIMFLNFGSVMTSILSITFVIGSTCIGQPVICMSIPCSSKDTKVRCKSNSSPPHQRKMWPHGHFYASMKCLGCKKIMTPFLLNHPG